MNNKHYQLRPGLLSPADAAAFLDLSEFTLARWRWSGTGPRHIKAGNRVRYPLAELESWMAEQILKGFPTNAQGTAPEGGV